MEIANPYEKAYISTCFTGQNFLSGTKLDVEIVAEIRQQTHILSKYAQRVCKETDRQFITVQKELTDLESVSNIKKVSDYTASIHTIRLLGINIGIGLSLHLIF